MSEDLQTKLLRRKEETASKQLLERLTRIRGREFVGDDRVLAERARERIRDTNRTDSTPVSSIGAHVDRGALSDWVEDLLASVDIGDRFYLFTALRFFPWLDCEVVSPGWGGELVDVSSAGLIVVSPDLAALAVVHEEEHGFDGFTFRRPPT